MPNVIIIDGTVNYVKLAATPSGSDVLSFSLHNVKTYMAGDEKKTSQMYIDCKLWGKSARMVLQDGDFVTVQGELKGEVYTDKETGVERRRHIINCQNVEVREAGGAPANAPPQRNADRGTDRGTRGTRRVNDEDMPTPGRGAAPANDDTKDHIPF